MTEPAVARFYLIVAALIRRGDEVLLVEQQGPEDAVPTWSLPGGRSHADELLPEALRREVAEETGLTLQGPLQLAYVAQLARHQPAMLATTFVFECATWSGDLSPNDPDGLIRSARFVDIGEAERLITQHPMPIMRDPVIAHLSGQAAAAQLWLYRQNDTGEDVRVTDGLEG